jgi:S1-C subfamily serine protease
MADVAIVRPVVLGLLTLIASCCWSAVGARLSAVADEADTAAAGPPPSSDVAPVTVRIEAVGCGWRTWGSGTLVADDLVISNRHVVEGTATVRVAGFTASGPWYAQATVVAASPDQDLVVLRLDSTARVAPVSLAPEGFAVGEPVAFGGFPGRQRLSVRSGMVSSRWTMSSPSARGPVWVVSEAGTPGMSGGPVLDGDGRLVGVVFAFEQRSRTSLALGADLIAALVAQAHDRTTPIVVPC